MNFLTIITLLKGLFMFPKEIAALVRLLQGTPRERHDKVMEVITKEEDVLAKTGRPTWGS